jgi:large subunit ribosomal protein L30
MSNSNMSSDKLIKVTQVRSSSGHNFRQKRTLSALGLGKIGKSSFLPVNDCVYGMINSVIHLINFERKS